MAGRPLADVLRSHTPELLEIPGVVGTGEGMRDGRSVFLVLVERDTPELRARIPSEIEGFAVSIQVTGEIRKLSGP
jgi:hypothetical protein